MKNYIDGLVGLQRLYSTAVFLLFINCMVLFLKKGSDIKDQILPVIPIIGLKAPDDLVAKFSMTMFSVGISLWVSVGLRWWLYSFNKNHPEEHLDTYYLPGLLFMPFWIRGLAGLLIAVMLLGVYPRNGRVTQFVILMVMMIIVVAPLMFSDAITRKFKTNKIKRKKF